MGGDLAPKAIVQGALDVAGKLKNKLLLVGVENQIRPLLGSNPPSNIEIVHASEWVEMDEKPVEAYRRKPDSSMRVCANLVKEGRAGAFVSAGNTGAATTTSLLTWRQMQGIHRPAIATQMPNLDGGYLLLDSGASPDADPEHLVEFAILGRAFMETVGGRKNATVHLLNIGEEEGKGSAFAKQAYSLLKEYSWFKGNIEGKEMFTKPCDVVVCDAFVGNIALKTSEGVADMIAKMVRSQVPTNKISQIPYYTVKKVFTEVKNATDWQEVGGSPLLGLNGTCIISHGRSTARAIHQAVLIAERAVQNDLIGAIRKGAEELSAML